MGNQNTPLARQLVAVLHIRVLPAVLKDLKAEAKRRVMTVSDVIRERIERPVGEEITVGSMKVTLP
jgi:hypothetical protein